MNENDITLKRINGLNKLLMDVYNNDKKISNILTEERFTKSELLEMKSKLTDYADKVFILFADRYKDRSDCKRLWDVIIKRYALADGKSYTLEEIGILYGISRERIRQLQKKGQKRIQPYLRKIVIDSACLVLGKEVNEKIQQKHCSKSKIYLTRAMNSLGLSEAYPWVNSTRLANELYKSGYLMTKVHAGKLQFFPSEKGIKIGFRNAASKSHSRVYLEENAQKFIASFVREKFGSNQ